MSKPDFDYLKPKMIGEYRVHQEVYCDEEEDMVDQEVLVPWTVVKDIISDYERHIKEKRKTECNKYLARFREQEMVKDKKWLKDD